MQRKKYNVFMRYLRHCRLVKLRLRRLRRDDPEEYQSILAW